MNDYLVSVSSINEDKNIRKKIDVSQTKMLLILNRKQIECVNFYEATIIITSKKRVIIFPYD